MQDKQFGNLDEKGDAEDILAYSEHVLNQFKDSHMGSEASHSMIKAHVTLKKKASENGLI